MPAILVAKEDGGEAKLNMALLSVLVGEVELPLTPQQLFLIGKKFPVDVVEYNVLGEGVPGVQIEHPGKVHVPAKGAGPSCLAGASWTMEKQPLATHYI